MLGVEAEAAPPEVGVQRHRRGSDGVAGRRGSCLASLATVGSGRDLLPAVRLSAEPEVGTAIATEAADSLLLAGVVERAFLPTGDGRREFGELRVIEREGRLRQSVDPRQDLREHPRVEAPVFLLGEVEQPVEPVALRDSHEVGEVPSFGASEQRQELVDGEQCLLGDRYEPVDGEGARTEEVEIPRRALDVASDDERRPAGQSEALGLGHSSKDSRDLFLQGTQHSRSALPVMAEPLRPRRADVGGGRTSSSKTRASSSTSM